jgi:DNA adenine methylase
MDARFNRDELIRRIEKIGRFSSRITVTRRDAAAFLQDDLTRIARPLIYLDPPYFVKGQKGARLYEDYYSHADHVVVANVVKRLKVPWIVSYDAAPEVAALYGKFATIRYSLAYSASAHSASGDEFMFFSRGLLRPSVVSPAGVESRLVDATRLRAIS